MNELIKRETIENMFRHKLSMLNGLEKLKNLDKKIDEEFHVYDGYGPYRIDWRLDNFHDNRQEKYVDRTLWRYLVGLYELQKYMLCTEYDKMIKEIEDFKTPDFNVENANGWLTGLRAMIYENVRLMCKRVYAEIIQGHYYTGGSSHWNADKKKRNNNGVDSWFILSTNDYSRIFGYWKTTPTITDDLEKVCYILDGKSLPADTVIIQAKTDKVKEVECPYFKIKFCQNGNTHYKLTDKTKERLNLIGPDGNVIGENIRIKILED